MTWRVAGASRATIGTRANQEDASAIWPSDAEAATTGGSGLLAVVADGMGGHAGGEIAGTLACETFLATFTAADTSTVESLGAALDAGNGAIAARVASETALRGMGCTLIGAWVGADGMRWISVGDSLLLLFRAPDVLRLNADHSLGAFLDEQARKGQISKAEAERNPYRNALRSALTGKAIEIVDAPADAYALADGDWIILATDGIATLAGDEIGDVVYTNRDATPEKMAESLIAAVVAKREPEQDNTTVVVLKVEHDPNAAACAADEAPTRVLRATAEAAAPQPAPASREPDEGVATTQRIIQPPAFQTLLRRHRTLVLVAAMGLMFAVGWALRAALG